MSTPSDSPLINSQDPNQQPGINPAERPRTRSRTLSIDKEVVAERIEKFFDADNEDRQGEIEVRIQRYAKYRMWVEEKMWPWEGATSFANPDMMAASMRLQDTLHNAVLAQRPPITATATKKNNKKKEESINRLLDHQFFIEQPGEDIIGDLAEDFVNEGFFTAYIPWIDEKRMVTEIQLFPPIPADKSVQQYMGEIVKGLFPGGSLIPSVDGWDWKIQLGKKKRAKVSFFTRDDKQVEAEIERETQVYDGPRVIRKDVQEVLHPIRCENLQIKSPSNPHGASHVILKDYPTIDEIRRLTKSKFYDLITPDELKDLEQVNVDESNQDREAQKDALAGGDPNRKPPLGAESHKPLTRLMCFDTFDINGDGIDEDVVFWMILETKTILRARHLTQMFPSSPPRRPFAEGKLFPVPGRRYAIGILEMMEGLHDLIQQLTEQAGDAGTLANSPFGFYKQTSSMKPEVIRLWPGELYPLNDPQKDVNFPQFGNQSQTFAFNMIATLQQAEEKLTTIGDLQLGRVPQGKASALRTVSGIQTVLGQGDARPERVLRRFFGGLKQIWMQMHELNKSFLKKKKQFMITGFSEPVSDPYTTINSSQDVTGEFIYQFSANVLNTSKEATQQALQGLMAAYVNPLAIQMGIINPDGVYRLFRDYGKSLGQDPDNYITAPSVTALEPPIFAEDAVDAIMSNQVPSGNPAEGFEAHFQKLRNFSETEAFGLLTKPQVELLREYMERLGQLMQQERQRQAILQASQDFQNNTQGGGGGRVASAPDNSKSPLQDGEVIDETLPSEKSDQK